MRQDFFDRESVLILDQEPAIRGFLEIVFGSAGYTPLVADTKLSAIRLAESSAGRITLVLADSLSELEPILEYLRPGARIALAVDYEPVVARYAARMLVGGRSDEPRMALYSALIHELIACSQTTQYVGRSWRSMAARLA